MGGGGSQFPLNRKSLTFQYSCKDSKKVVEFKNSLDFVLNGSYIGMETCFWS